jgi:alpha-D-ribose 1-methylphosphonate 5-triphosphate synthase subunit PhnH
MDTSLLRERLHFWVGQGVLEQRDDATFTVVSDGPQDIQVESKVVR